MNGMSSAPLATLRTQRCLVLGGSGFIGVNLCHSLRHAAASVRAFSRTTAAVDGVEWIAGDLADIPALERVLVGIDLVFHLAGSSTPAASNLEIAADARHSIVSSVKLLEACRGAGVRRVVFASSGGTVYGESAEVPTSENAPTEPISAYGVAKLAVEKYLAVFERLHGMTGMVLRISNPYGPFQTGRHQQGLIGTVIGKILAGEPIAIWGDGSVVRDYLFIDDLIRALELVADYQGDGRIWNIGSGIGLSICDVVRIVGEGFGFEPEIRWGPARSVDVRRAVLDCTRARSQLGWSCAVQIEAGVARTIAWFRGAKSALR
jgi:UDP-glucose 4-epimerase